MCIEFNAALKIHVSMCLLVCPPTRSLLQSDAMYLGRVLWALSSCHELVCLPREHLAKTRNVSWKNFMCIEFTSACACWCACLKKMQHVLEELCFSTCMHSQPIAVLVLSIHGG